MDDPNNTNSNNPSPTPPFGAPPPPIPDFGNPTAPTPPPPNEPIPSWLPPLQPIPPQPEPFPTPSIPNPPQPEPIPSTEPMPAPAPVWTPPPVQPEPSFAPPTMEPNPVPIEPTPTFTPPQPEEKPVTQPSWMAAVPDSAPDSQESAPTDLSHLISNNYPEPGSTQPVSDTMVVPNPPAESHKGIPRWLIGLGAGLLIIVIGASAYFILGIGQPKTTTSLPAATAPQTAEVKTPPTIPVQPTTQPATGSANFGQLENSGGTQSEATSSSMDLIRQRQQQGI